MPQIKEVPFLKGEELEVGQLYDVTFLSPHEEISAEDSGVERDLQQILVEISGALNGKRVWTMNKTSQRMIVGLHGDNSDNWVGKTVKIYVLEQNMRGQLKKVIYVKGTQKV